jgi:hypothetical protein
MKYFFATYKTVIGEHAYAEFGALAASSWNSAEKRAIKGKHLFTRLGLEECCFLDHMREIPRGDFVALKKYFANV